jgi:integrase
VIANFRGKGGRERTVALPPGSSRRSTRGPVFRQGDRDRALRSREPSRTCAKLWRENGGDLEQIKFLLGHSSIQTTERYPGSGQRIAVAVNDNLGLLRDRKSAIPSGLYFNRHEAQDGL